MENNDYSSVKVHHVIKVIKDFIVQTFNINKLFESWDITYVVILKIKISQTCIKGFFWYFG